MNRIFFLALASSLATLIGCSEETDGPANTVTDTGSVTDAASDGATDTAPRTDSGLADADAATDSGLTAQEQAYCAAVASHATCDGGTASDCEGEGRCFFGRKMAPAAAAAFNTCHSSPSCKGEDECVEVAGRAAGGSAATNYSNSCSTKIGTCSGVRDDYCTAGAFAYPGVGEAMSACLSKPCEELTACFTAAIASLAECDE